MKVCFLYKMKLVLPILEYLRDGDVDFVVVFYIGVSLECESFLKRLNIFIVFMCSLNIIFSCTNLQGKLYILLLGTTALSLVS